MSLSLVKGENTVLASADKPMGTIVVGLGWDPRKQEGTKFDLDANALMLGEDGKVINNEGIIYFGQKESACKSITHKGDNLTGEGEGDDETIEMNLNTIPENVKEVLIHVVIHQAAERGQNFGQVDNAFVRVFDKEDEANTEIRYDLAEDFSAQTVVNFARIYRHNGGWKMKAIGEGQVATLRSMAETYGVQFG